MNPATLKSIVQLATVVIVLAAAGVLATLTTTLTGTQVFYLVGVIAGGTAVAGGLALNSPTTSLIPHLILIAVVIGLTVALALENVFGNVEVGGVFTFILGGGAVGAGSSITTTANAVPASPVQPAPEPVVVPPVVVDPAPAV